MDFENDTKVVRIDDRGRITIPSEYRKYFPPNAKVMWKMVGSKLVVSFEGADNVKFLTDEFLQNQILDLRHDLMELASSVKELRRLAFRKLMQGPEAETKNSDAWDGKELLELTK